MESRNVGSWEEAINECNANRGNCYMNSGTDAAATKCMNRYTKCLSKANENSPW